MTPSKIILKMPKAEIPNRNFSEHLCWKSMPNTRSRDQALEFHQGNCTHRQLTQEDEDVIKILSIFFSPLPKSQQ
jgi:hypothetical protein